MADGYGQSINYDERPPQQSREDDDARSPDEASVKADREHHEETTREREG